MNMPLVLLNRRRRGFTAFSPSSLYSSGSQGIWLDPSDLTTMFSDRAGTIPVTTPGTVVGKRLDKSGRGNHAVAPTDAARPIYGVEPKGGRRNLVIVSEPTKAQLTVASAGVTDAAAFGTFARSIQFPAGAVSENTYLAGETSWVSGVTATLSVYVRMDDGLAPVFGSAVTSNVANDFAINIRGALPTPNANIITDLGGGIYRVSATGTTGANVSNSGVIRFATNSGRGFRVTGYTLELGSTATAYQRVTTAYDITESGVATCHYVQYDGSDDSMSTAAIDFTATDKMSVFAGVRKLSDAATAVLLEHSASIDNNNGTFLLTAPSGNGAVSHRFSSKGTVLVDAGAGTFAVAPISSVLSGLGDISGDVVTLRRNGTQVAQSTLDQGTGNYGNYPFYIGRRNNATLPFNGKDYGILVVGKAVTPTETTDTETWLAAKTSGVTI